MSYLSSVARPKRRSGDPPVKFRAGQLAAERLRLPPACKHPLWARGTIQRTASVSALVSPPSHTGGRAKIH